MEKSPEIMTMLAKYDKDNAQRVSADFGKNTRPNSLKLSNTFRPSTPITTRSKRQQKMPTKSPESLPSITSVMKSPMFSPLNSPFKQAKIHD